MLYILLLLYTTAIIFTIGRILLDTESASKTLAYIMLVVFLPIVGVLFYFSFGVNYRHRKLDAQRQRIVEELGTKFNNAIPYTSENILEEYQDELGHFSALSHFIFNLGKEGITRNSTHLLLNGEEKFPDVIESLENAQKFIHMEYYTWENDIIGNQIKDVLIRKAKEGIEVRVLYDDFGSHTIRRNIVKEMRKHGIEIYPVIKVNLTFFANRLNHRDHRKIIIIDGKVGYVGGINISDRYDNRVETNLFWRDTHMRITGPAVLFLHRHFMIIWNDCQSNMLSVSEKYFPLQPQEADNSGQDLTQIVSGGPIYRFSNIMLTYSKIFNDARDRLFITNPYFIPSESILSALQEAAISGVDVRLLVPDKSDSMLVGAASKFYFGTLLEAGVRIFLYQRGFVHAKTVVADGRLAVVGTANMDNRSFDLNFEIMAVNFGTHLASELEKTFNADLELSKEITLEEWRNISLIRKLGYSIARLVSSFL